MRSIFINVKEIGKAIDEGNAENEKKESPFNFQSCKNKGGEKKRKKDNLKRENKRNILQVEKKQGKRIDKSKKKNVGLDLRIYLHPCAFSSGDKKARFLPQ